MIAEWLEETEFGSGVAGIANVNAGNEALVTYDGYRLDINGAFDRLRLYDISGTLRIETAEQSFNVNNLPSGIYIALIQQGSSVTPCRIMIR